MIVPGVLILFLAILGWISTAILVWAAWQRPRIGVLTERAALGVFLSLFCTIYGLAALNSDQGFAVFDEDTVRTIIRLLVLALGLIPAYWVYLYKTGRLGGGDE